MSWEEIRAAYPPDTWLLLEVTERWHGVSVAYDPVRVLEAGEHDRMRDAKWERGRTTGTTRDLLVVSTAEDRLVFETSFNGLMHVDDAEDEGLVPVRVVVLRPSRDYRRAASGGGGTRRRLERF
jgi:hypothetical protein